MEKTFFTHFGSCAPKIAKRLHIGQHWGWVKSSFHNQGVSNIDCMTQQSCLMPCQSQDTSLVDVTSHITQFLKKTP